MLTLVVITVFGNVLVYADSNADEIAGSGKYRSIYNISSANFEVFEDGIFIILSVVDRLPDGVIATQIVASENFDNDIPAGSVISRDEQDIKAAGKYDNAKHKFYLTSNYIYIFIGILTIATILCILLIKSNYISSIFEILDLAFPKREWTSMRYVNEQMELIKCSEKYKKANIDERRVMMAELFKKLERKRKIISSKSLESDGTFTKKEWESRCYVNEQMESIRCSEKYKNCGRSCRAAKTRATTKSRIQTIWSLLSGK
jgi:hypothetical protein